MRVLRARRSLRSKDQLNRRPTQLSKSERLSYMQARAKLIAIHFIYSSRLDLVRMEQGVESGFPSWIGSLFGPLFDCP
jgi:hypothetical protein